MSIIFEDIHWTESKITSIGVAGRELVITASEVINTIDSSSNKVKVTFKDVAAAHRTVSEYIGDRRNPVGFKEKYSIEEIPPKESLDTVGYFLEGVTVFEPIAWIDLDVRAKSVTVEIQ